MNNIYIRRLGNVLVWFSFVFLILAQGVSAQSKVTVRNWALDSNARLNVMKLFIEMAKEYKVILRLPAEYYVKELDLMILNAFQKDGLEGLDSAAGVVIHQYGHVWLTIEPQPAGKGFEFVNRIVGGAIPREFIAPVQKGVIGAMEEGVLAGYPMVDVKVTLFDGSYHDVDSSEMAFKIAGSMAFKDGARRANPILLEPLMSVEIITPEEFMGQVISDLNSRRGKTTRVEYRKGTNVIAGEVPLANMFGYATDLRSLTQGRATFTLQFSRYSPVPSSVSEEVLSELKRVA